MSEASVENLPLDVEGATDTVDTALDMKLNAVTRQDIDTRTGALLGFMRELLTVDLGWEQRSEVMALYRTCYHLLDLKRRPSSETPAYESFEFMREAALRTQALLALYVAKIGVSAS
ncbi:hypothetical protein [Streptomyces ardesiacus]|uniref:hypothetical protein n=1 Tax=Streptomyces ardesiacus TaxID=285564 RepID=UPI0038133F1C